MSSIILQFTWLVFYWCMHSRCLFKEENQFGNSKGTAKVQKGASVRMRSFKTCSVKIGVARPFPFLVLLGVTCKMIESVQITL